jgi:hypothetical protein
MQPEPGQLVALERGRVKPLLAVAGQGVDTSGQKKPAAVGEELLLEVAVKQAEAARQ